jgi:hypothetical protein
MVNEANLGWYDPTKPVPQQRRGIPIVDAKHNGLMIKKITQLLPKPRAPRAKTGRTQRGQTRQPRERVSSNKVHLTPLKLGVYY